MSDYQIPPLSNEVVQMIVAALRILNIASTATVCLNAKKLGLTIFWISDPPCSVSSSPSSDLAVSDLEPPGLASCRALSSPTKIVSTVSPLDTTDVGQEKVETKRCQVPFRSFTLLDG
jgi:hypothetical protein